MNPPSLISQLNLIATHILAADYTAALSSLHQAAKHAPDQEQEQTVIDRFHLIIRYEQYERMPGETNIFITDVAVRKEKSGGLPKKQPNSLPLSGNPAWAELEQFLNARLQQWEWRCLRNLLRGSRFAPDVSGIASIYQKQLRLCKELFEKGEIHAAILAAEFCRMAGAANDANDWLMQAYNKATEENDLLSLAHCHLLLGDWLAAPYSSPILWNFALESSSSQSSSLPATVESIEFTMPSADHILQARQTWEQAEGYFRQNNFALGIGQVLVRMGYLAFLQEDFSETVLQAQQAKKIFIDNADNLNAMLASTYEMLGLILLNKISEARTLAQQVGEWGQRSGNISWSAGLGLLASRLARHLMLRKGMAEQALKAYSIVRELQLAVGAKYHAAQHLTDIGEVYKATGQSEAAIIHFEQAVDEITAVLDGDWEDFQDQLHTTIHTRTGIAMLLSDNVILAIRRMDADLIDRSISRMQAICERIKETASQEQLAELPQVGQVFGLYENFRAQASVLSPLFRAKQHRETGDLAGFEKFWKKSETALLQTSPELQGLLGSSVYGMKKDWERAGASIRKYLELGGATAGFIGEMMKFMEQFGDQGKEEIRLQQYRFHSQAFSGLVRTRQFTAAQTHLDTLVEAFGETWWKREDSPWHALTETGEMWEGLGQFEKALASYDKALEELELRRSQLSRDELKIALSGSQNTHYLYTYAARAAMSANLPERAFGYAEKGKARGLLDLMSENRFFATNDMGTKQLLLQLREIDSRYSLHVWQLAQERSVSQPNEALVNLISGKLVELETERSKIEQELSQSLPDFKKKSQPVVAVSTVESVASQLDNDTLLVEYLFMGEDLIVWAINWNGIIHAEAFKLEDWVLKGEITKLRNQLATRQAWRDAAAVLSNRLLNPIADAVRQHGKIIFVPHGSLHSLPFQVLPFDGQPLGLSKAISFLPSASALEFLEKTSDLPTANVLSIGNPTGDLPAAAVEALFVANQFGENSNHFIGKEATETTVRKYLPEATLLHFATHGNLSEEAPMQSSILLANGESITLYELMGIQLRANLVVLSACDTGRGTHTGGDDVLGLTRGLIAGGAKSAMVSLWQVNDVSTGLLMGHFYQQLKQGHSAPEALRLAQVYLSNLDRNQQLAALKKMEMVVADEMVRGGRSEDETVRGISSLTDHEEEIATGYDHPFYWGAFVLVGR